MEVSQAVRVASELCRQRCEDKELGMEAVLKRQGGFFTVRSDGTQELGTRWPAGGLVLPKPQHAVVARYKTGADQVQVLHGSTFEDALLEAQLAVSCRGAEAARVARCVGTYGRPAVYETSFVVVQPGREDGTELPFMPPTVPKYVERDGRQCPTKTVDAEIKVRGETIEGLASTTSIDRDMDRIEANAFADSLPAFMAKNPIVLFNHSPMRPIGTVTEARIVENGLFVRIKVTDVEIRKLIAEGVLRTFSVSFILNDFGFEGEGDPGSPEIRVIRRAELLEVSVVSIPSNRDATFQVVKSFQGRGRGNGLVAEVEKAAGKLCCPVNLPELIDYRAFPVADAGTAWSFDERDVKSRFGHGLARLCGTFERDGQVLLRHHSVVDGELKTVPMGVRIAMAQVLAGDAPLTEDERRSSWVHLARHFEEFGAEAPELTEKSAPGLYASTLGFDEPGLIFSKSQFPSEASAREWATARGFKLGQLVDGSHTRRAIPKGRSAGDQVELCDGVTAVLTRKDETMNEPNAATPPAAPETPAATPEGAAPQDPKPSGSDAPATPPAGGDPAEPSYSAEDVGRAVAAGIAASQKPGGSPEGDADLAQVEVPVSEETARLVEAGESIGYENLSPEARQRLREGLKEDLKPDQPQT